MRTLITGATGMVGNQLLRHLPDCGEITLLLRTDPLNNILPDRKYSVVYGDIRDQEALNNALKGIDQLYHIAGSIKGSIKDLYETNVVGTEKMMKAAVKNGVKRVVYVSSIAAVAHGTPESPASEQSEYNFDQYELPYNDSKHKGELIALKYEKEHDLDLVVVNPGYVLGPCDWKKSSGDLLLKALKGNIFYPKTTTSIVHSGDVAKGLIKAMARGKSGRRYIITGENIPYRDIFKILFKITDKKRPLVPIPRWLGMSLATLIDHLNTGGIGFSVSGSMLRSGFLGHYVDNSRSIDELGMDYRSPELAIKDACEWFKKESVIKY